MSVSVQTRDRVTIVTLDRQHAKNAVDRDTAQELADAFRAFDEDENADVAILHGAHGTFCSGADLKAVAQGNPNRLEFDGDGPMGPSRMLLQKPVIAAISGYAVAGGLELALWCDLRVAEKGAILGVFCRRFGVPLIDGGTIRLPRLIGLSRALDLILTGRPVDAEEAFSMGLVNRLAEPGEVLDVAFELARSLTVFPQACMRHDRLSAYEQFGMSLDEALHNEFAHGMQAFDKGAVEGATRFSHGQGRGGSFDLSPGENN